LDALRFPTGVVFTALKRIPHSKGDVFHALKSSEESYKGFGEAYFTVINSGETKGWKRHSRMNLNLIVPVGKVKFQIKASVEESAFEVIIGDNNYGRLSIPPGYWVAFSGASEFPSLILNIADIPHDPTESENMDFV
jgi:dTDP-4-dehydrorhamnose 3,5-epimerase